jgi:hypothetical protein
MVGMRVGDEHIRDLLGLASKGADGLVDHRHRSRKAGIDQRKALGKYHEVDAQSARIDPVYVLGDCLRFQGLLLPLPVTPAVSWASQGF